MFPVSAKVEICGMCSLDCNFCYHKVMKAEHLRQRMILENDFERILSFLKTIPSMKEVGLFYIGESGLHPKLCDFYRMLKEEGYFTYLTTNGTTTSNILRAIPFIDSLKVSWNYIDQQDFVMKTHADSSLYSKIVQNINILHEECNKNSKKLAISTVLDTKKEDYSASLAQLQHDEHYWIPLQTQCGTNSDGADGVVGESEHIRDPLPCWSLFKGLYIDSDMNIRTCCYGHHACHVLYNIRNVQKFIIPSKLLHMRELHLQHKIPDECKQCLRSVL